MALRFNHTFDQFTCFAHRGAKGLEPENTLLAFERSIKLGCPWLELDVRLAAGQLVVIHDREVDRTTNGKGLVCEQSIAHLQSLDAGKGEKIPTLKEVIEQVDHRAGINIELKARHTGEAAVRLLADCFDLGWCKDEFLISSFDHDELAHVRDLDKGMRIGPLFGKPADYFPTTQTLNATSLHLSKSVVHADTVAEAHDRGLKVFVYTVNEPDEYALMRALKVDGIFTDYPDKYLGQS